MSEQNGQALMVPPAATSIAREMGMDEERLAILQQMHGDLHPKEFVLFLAVAARTGLDPYLKQIYAIKANGKFFIHVGIDGRRLIAQRTGMVDGAVGPQWCGPDGAWRDVWLSDDPPAAARYGVLKKGCREPFWGVARLKSFRPNPSSPNAGRVDHYLAKVAEDHALRKAFPYEMGGAPTYYPEHDVEPPPNPPSDSDGTARSGWPHFEKPGADQEAEYREVDQETGEITETSQETNGKPPWADTPLGRQVLAMTDALDAGGKKYEWPADDADEATLTGWIASKKTVLQAARGS